MKTCTRYSRISYYWYVLLLYFNCTLRVFLSSFYLKTTTSYAFFFFFVTFGPKPNSGWQYKDRCIFCCTISYIHRDPAQKNITATVGSTTTACCTGCRSDLDNLDRWIVVYPTCVTFIPKRHNEHRYRRTTFDVRTQNITRQQNKLLPRFVKPFIVFVGCSHHSRKGTPDHNKKSDHRRILQAIISSGCGASLCILEATRTS